MKILECGGQREVVVERADRTAEQVRATLAGQTLAILGYGTQGRAQALNLRDSGYEVILGLRNGPSFDLACQDGWQPGYNLLTLDAAADRGMIIFYLLSDAGQKEHWPALLPRLTPGKTLVFAHGFSIVYQQQTGVVPPPHVDVLLVAPKGSGTTLRRGFVTGEPLNVGYAVHQDHSEQALERCLALCHAIGTGNAFATTLQREVICDLVGERGSLLGAIYGMWLAQYEVLRDHGHSAIEAFSETVEEATQSLYPLIAEKGIDWMYAHCSTTAQRGALDWFRRFRDVLRPVFEELYREVAAGKEAQRALATNSQPDYREQLARELAEIADSEMWTTGRLVRGLRP
ncbi:MAG TPA: ketol-acid reductoisomerase [Gemmatales bacterium]|nr:ketol-acid reductoisomerase [Gemmatales bacterium]HMP58917.1 ketol-acid reductoisomerase [Gemmatales bacterium]